jgi:lipopolysaccharide transport system ATP-binding protein
MSRAAIAVDRISKKYRIGHRKARYRTLRDTLADMAMAPARRLRSFGRASHCSKDEIWALRDVSFEVTAGEVLGVIGRNGSGKSTLLKILSRITEPTTGSAEIRGRVGSLLEVGTGFHPELTGRENVYLSGNILGMKRAEVDRRFDEIVEFSGVEQFIDTPVKRYSSGMRVRLGFAVAAHLEPEILLVDEVLAVGDAAFQKRCMGKMGEEASQGRTVVFVSHNMGAVAALTDRCLVLVDGQVSVIGSPSEAIESYLSECGPQVSHSADLSDVPRTGTGRARFMSVQVTALDDEGSPCAVIHPGGDVKIELGIRAESVVHGANVAVTVNDAAGSRLIDVNSALSGEYLDIAAGNTISVSFVLRDVLLKPGRYGIDLWMGRGSVEAIDRVPSAAQFVVEQDVTRSVHSEVFPGVYQCRFDLLMDEPC